ncbi:tetratricopeptide repeat protein [Lachnoclostridium sp. An138]|uniref:tetratricopeptide repeat protein n=1 Tax=Lachnoclostridium sp. An138 TaxID=1965560 RepID=UPI000B39F7B9|nr:tetratricopeptide repeat protein [Lachnoclostridium sp. An138]OUQ15521.1 hypothetical protein B5E82_15600 [Lachnoclostridium sp. An138]
MKKYIFVVCIMCIFLTACSGRLELQIREQLDLGTQYLSEGQYEEAIVAFQKVITLEPKQVEAHKGLGQAYQYCGEAVEDIVEKRDYFSQAAEEYEVVLEQNPEDTEVQEWLETVLNQIEELDQQIEAQKQEELVREEYADLLANILDLFVSEDYEQIYELMRGEEYAELCKNFQGDLIFLQEGNIGLGFYVHGIYYGEYEGRIRQGEGIWMCNYGMAEEEWMYVAQGTWEQDLPNGEFTEEIQTSNSEMITKGRVIDGVWDGPATEETTYTDGRKETYQISFTDGKFDILRTYVGGDGDIIYVYGDNGEDEAATSDIDYLRVISGTEF